MNIAHQLTTKPSLGTMYLTWSEGSTEHFPLGQGRFSWTPHQGFYLVNFWVVSEYEVLLPDGSLQLVTGPTLEILTRTDQAPYHLTNFKLTVPNRSDAQEDWDILHATGFYNNDHQDLDDATLVITGKHDRFYDLQFSGTINIDGTAYTVTGQCSLALSDTLERYW